MKKIIFPSLISVLMLFISCTEDSPFVSESNLVVVQAYLYADEPVRDIRLTSTLPLDADSTNAPPINDAQVILIKEGQRYVLDSSQGDSGYYHYSGNDLSVKSGDEFAIEIEYMDQIISSQTIVPEAPDDLAISGNTINVPSGISFFDLMSGEYDYLNLELSWQNDDSEMFFVVLDNLETNPDALDLGLPEMPNRFISQPISRDSFPIRLPMITHYGRHGIKLYRINQEYADLYQSRNQDSRDLNEPLTNIENGLGVFSAFNSDSVFFDVIQN